MQTEGALHITLIAGERSGDQLGASLIHALRAQSARPVAFSGIAGSAMKEAGMDSLFAMEELSVMGFAEVLPHIFRLKRRIRQTVQHIEATRPDMVVTIDSPGFTFRVVAALRKRGYHHSKFVHYVAPTVWAYKPERAAKTAGLFDALLTLFAFEVPYFTKEKLATYWVGHEAAASAPEHFSPLPENKDICIFAGSRKNELKRHLPVLRELSELLKASVPELSMVMPLPSGLMPVARALTRDWPCPLRYVGSSERFEAMQHARVGIVKSGTITLEAALHGLASVVLYKAHPISAWIVRRLIQTRSVALPNILLRAAIIPEYLQERATAPLLLQSILPLLTQEDAALAQRQAFSDLRRILLPDPSRNPSEIAAERILGLLAPAA